MMAAFTTVILIHLIKSEKNYEVIKSILSIIIQVRHMTGQSLNYRFDYVVVNYVHDFLISRGI